MPIQSGSRALASDVVTATRKLVARGRRESNSTATTTEVGVLRIDDVPITGGRAYFVQTSSLVLHSTVPADRVRASIRYTTDGSTPSTSSTLMGIVQEQVDATANPPAQPALVGYFPSSDETLSLLLTVSRQAGTGSVDILGSSTFPIEVFLIDMGVDPGDTGVDI